MCDAYIIKTSNININPLQYRDTIHNTLASDHQRNQDALYCSTHYIIKL